MSIDRADFETLLRRVLDAGPDALSPDEAAQFQSALLTDPDCRAAYLQAAALHATLCLEHTPAISPLSAPAPTPKPDVSPPRANVRISPTPDTPQLSAAGVPMYRKGYEPQPFKLRPHHFALIAATLLAACGVAIYLIAFNAAPTDDPNPVDPNQPPPPVATLIQNSGNLRTPHGYPAEGDDYGRGEYSLSTGTAEFMLTNAVNVKLRGDTRLFMRNNMNVALTRGTAAFVVPQGAKGFTVALPGGAKVVDLGTAFSIDTHAFGGSIIRVTEGAVVVRDSAGQEIAIAADQSFAVDSAGSLYAIERADLVGDRVLAAFDLNASDDTDATQPLFVPADARRSPTSAQHNGIAIRVTTDHHSGRLGRDRGVSGPIASSDIADVLRDFTFADSLTDSRLTVELTGLDADTQYRLRWYHYHSSRSDDYDRVAVYQDSTERDHLLFESQPYGDATDPVTAGYTDFVARSDRDGRVLLLTGPHSGGRSIQMLNGFAVLGAVIPEPAEPDPKP